MKEPTPLSAVKEFHETFDLPVQPQPIIPGKDRIELRINLLREELKELEEALQDNDLVEVADALADLQYVLSGAVLEFGMGNAFQSLFDEVHRSNMSKVCPTEAVAKRTADHYNGKGQDSEIVRKGEDVYIVYRKDDGKVLKSVEYSQADLKSIIENARKK